jgi:hypothetical protein
VRVKRIVLSCVFAFFVLAIHPLSVSASPALFLIPDGTLIIQENKYWRSEAASDPYGIEWVTDFNLTEEIVVTSLSSSIVKFEKTYTLSINDAYQKQASVTYRPTHYGFKYLDEDYDEITSENSSTLTFSLTRNVNKSTGERVLAQNPYGATYVILRAFYDSSQVYSATSNSIAGFGAVSSLSNVFDVNATGWQIGEIVDENYTVSGENIIQGYETWVLERNNIPEGYSEYISKSEYEKTSGLLIRTSVQAGKTDDFYLERNRQIINLAGLIDDGFPDVSAPPGQLVDSLNPVEVIFQGTDNHFDHYNLYRNGSLYETNDALSTEWSFLLTPTSGNTTWTFEIVDTLGYSSNATTWLMYYIAIPESTSSLEVLSSTTSPASSPIPGMTAFIFIAAMFALILKRKKEKG